jgi:hypothetical protein
MGNKEIKEPKLRFPKSELRKTGIKAIDILNEKICFDEKTNLSIGVKEQKKWRKAPTMRVQDMAHNPDKAVVENFYIAEKKYKFHRDGKTFEQIRESLSSVYGGFTKDGTYYHHKNIYNEPAKLASSPPPRAAVSKLEKPKSRNKTPNMTRRGRNKSVLEPLELTPLMRQSFEPRNEVSARRSSVTHMVKNLNIMDMIAQMQQQKNNPIEENDYDEVLQPNRTKLSSRRNMHGDNSSSHHFQNENEFKQYIGKKVAIHAKD